MSRTMMSAIVIATISVLILAGVSKFLDTREKAELRAEGDSLRLHIAGTNVVLEQYGADTLAFAAWMDSTDRVNASLRVDLQSIQRATRVVVQARDSARTTIALDTLTPQLRMMIKLERDAAASFRNERDVERSLRLSVDTQFAQLRERMRVAELLIWTLAAERDSAMVLVARHEARFDFNLWRFLGDEIPQLMACAGGGMTVATINDGDLLIGAGIGLAACLIKTAVFK